MELKEFVTETICQIAEGVAEAQKRSKISGALVNPPLHNTATGMEINDGNKRNYIAHNVAFDVSVAVESSDSKGGKAKIFIAMLALEGGKDSKQSSTCQSRITFSVPVSWPPACEPEQDSGAACVASSPREFRLDGF